MGTDLILKPPSPPVLAIFRDFVIKFVAFFLHNNIQNITADIFYSLTNQFEPEPYPQPCIYCPEIGSFLALCTISPVLAIFGGMVIGLVALFLT